MGRVISVALIIIASIYVFTVVTKREGVFLATETLPSTKAPVYDPSNSIYGDFNETGTLVFYPNNIGPVPYLFYQNQSGETVSKAIIFSFPNVAPTDFSSWAGARISIIGKLDNEHVLVDRILYISAP